MTDTHDANEYCIVRFRYNGDNSVIKIGLTRDEAEAHCQRDDTRGDGWFDGFSTHENRSGDVAAFIDACG